ncbi:MAG: hypothetical protein ACREM1_13085 [Longimicrobiales bacterium]
MELDQAELGTRNSEPGTRIQDGDSYLLIVAGIGGEEAYRAAFTEWGASLAEAAVEKHGLPRANVTFLTEQPERAPEWTSGKATKAEIEQTVASLASKAGADDQVFVVLIGHGSYQSGESRFNVVGPNLTAEDLAVLLEAFGGTRVALVYAGSASGEVIKTLAADNRVIATATKSGMERNASVFGKYFAEAYAGDGADTDKDGRVSLLEAFTFARLQVEREYRDGNRLLTEHAVLDDTGAGAGTAEPDAEQGQGILAASMFIGGMMGAAAADATPELRALYGQKRQLEQELAALRANKAGMEQAAYDRELERLLVELAKVDGHIRTMEGR